MHVLRKFYLSQENFTCLKDQRTPLSTHFADIIYIFFKSYETRFKSIENSVDPDQPADQDPHGFPYNMILLVHVN